MKKRQKLLAFLLALLILASAGCTSSGRRDKEDDTKTDDSGSTSTDKSFGSLAGAPSDSDAQSDPQTIGGGDIMDTETMGLVKYNIYVEMNNEIVDVLDTLYSYYEVVEYADEFALLSDSPYTYKYNISPYNTNILEDAAYVASMSPAFEPLDDLTREIVGPMAELMEAFSAIYNDYDYAADQYAGPKEYHKAIQPNAATFEELAFQYMDAVAEASIERVAAGEQKMLDEGRALAYGFSHSITVVKKIVNACCAQEVDDYNLLELDLEPLQPLYQELADTVAAYKTAAEDNNQLMAESMTADGAYHYGTQMDRMVEALDWMFKQVREQYLASDPGRAYLGSLMFVNEVLADCIDQYNSSPFVS